MKLKRTILGPILVAMFAFVSGGWLLQRGSDDRDSAPDRQVLFEILQRISNDYVDEHSPDEIYRMAVDGFLQELGDPHTTFMTAADFERLQIQTTGEYAGLGIQIAERDGWITILAPLPGTPADRAGLRSGDRIVEVEGETTEGWSADDAVAVLRGGPGEPVTISIGRRGVEEPIEFDLVREEIHVNSVRTSYMIEPSVGYAKLDVFSETSTSELRQALTRLQSNGMTGIILDLRANPGGLLDQGVSVTDLFIEAGKPIVETRARDPRQNVTYRASTAESLDGVPIVVLVDEYAASASEIVAGALQDHDRALVIGAPSFGKGSVQTLFPLSGGNYLKMTTGKWYTPSGRSIQKEAQPASELALETTERTITVDGTAIIPEEADTTEREEYHTASGRVVYGGGGIIPDLIVRPDTLTTAEKEFFDAASKAGNTYADVLFRYAVDYVRANPSIQPTFTITPQMESELFNLLVAEGVEVTLAQMQSARRLVYRQLGLEIAQAKWGQEGRAQRANLDDNVIQRAVQLLQSATTQGDLFRVSANVAAR